jgi:P27 family predicted phage terminase small subunit
MGHYSMRGRKPKPSAIKELAGNPGKRPLNMAEPVPPPGVPESPMELSPEAQAEWNRICPLLIQMGVLSTVDTTALAAYCECFAQSVSATRIVRKVGAVIKTPTGYPIQSPYVSVASKALEQMRKLLTEFGMTPSSRSRINATPPSTDKGTSNPYAFLA